MIQYDKWLHGVISFGLAAVLFIPAYFLPVWPVSIALAMLVGIRKEILDWFSYGKDMGWKKFWPMTRGDLIADLTGIAVASFLFLLTRIL